MADIQYTDLPQKGTASVAWDFVLISDSEDSNKIKIQSATQFKGPKGTIWQGAYDNATAYVIDAIVSYNWSSYICIADTTWNLPTDTNYWELVAQKGDNTIHNDTIWLQGWTTNEYYHLTNQQYTDATSLTTTEYAQLANIDSSTISTSQWGYLWAMNQWIATTNNVTFWNIAWTLTTTSQPNITSVWTLTSLNTSGLIRINTNIWSIPTPLTWTLFHTRQADSSDNIITLDTHTWVNYILWRRSNWTGASPTAVTTDDTLLAILWRGYWATWYSWTSRARINLNAAETWTDSAQWSYLSFITTTIWWTTTSEKARIEDDWKVRIGTSWSLTNQWDLLLNKDGVLALKETTTPTADTNFGKIYTKTDNELYFQDGAGSEHQISNQWWGGTILKVAKTADETVNNSSTLQNDDELLLSLSANTTYMIEWIFFAAIANASHWLKLAFTIPTGATLRVSARFTREDYTWNTSGEDIQRLISTSWTAVNSWVTSFTSSMPVYIKWTVVVWGTAWNLQLQWAQQTAGASNTTVLAKSNLQATAI